MNNFAYHAFRICAFMLVAICSSQRALAVDMKVFDFRVIAVTVAPGDYMVGKPIAIGCDWDALPGGSELKVSNPFGIVNLSYVFEGKTQLINSQTPLPVTGHWDNRSGAFTMRNPSGVIPGSLKPEKPGTYLIRCEVPFKMPMGPGSHIDAHPDNNVKTATLVVKAAPMAAGLKSVMDKQLITTSKKTVDPNKTERHCAANMPIWVEPDAGSINTAGGAPSLMDGKKKVILPILRSQPILNSVQCGYGVGTGSNAVTVSYQFECKQPTKSNAPNSYQCDK